MKPRKLRNARAANVALAVGIVLGLSPLSISAQAEEPPVTAPVSENPPSASVVPAPVPTRGKTASAKRGQRREKEAEGAQAPRSFEAEAVLKSRYKLDGHQLEVDPE